MVSLLDLRGLCPVERRSPIVPSMRTSPLSTRRAPQRAIAGSDMTVIELAHFTRTVRRASPDLSDEQGRVTLHLSASAVRDPAVPSA